MATVRYVKLERGLVSVTGADRQTFLQGLISQDVDRISANHAAYGALLTPQGKYLHDFCLAEIDDHLILDSEKGRTDELISRMTRFKLRAEVKLECVDDFTVIAVFSPDAPAALDLAANPGAARPLGGGIAFVDPRSAELGCRLLLPTTDAPAVLASLPTSEAKFEDYDALRIRLGIPDGVRDMDVDKSTLLECNFESLNGIDWGKGCYIGQEITARTKYRGLIKHQLVPVSVGAEAPSPGTAILAGDQKVGEIRSILDGFAIALLRLDALEKAQNGHSLTAAGASILPLST
jgi:hypothetical protein